MNLKLIRHEVHFSDFTLYILGEFDGAYHSPMHAIFITQNRDFNFLTRPISLCDMSCMKCSLALEATLDFKTNIKNKFEFSFSRVQLRVENAVIFML